jgi:hypothetical protein
VGLWSRVLPIAGALAFLIAALLTRAAGDTTTPTIIYMGLPGRPSVTTPALIYTGLPSRPSVTTPALIYIGFPSRPSVTTPTLIYIGAPRPIMGTPH